MNLSLYAANALLDGTPMPATLYAQLHVGNPGQAGTANLATVTTRKSYTRTAAALGAATNVLVVEWLSYPAADLLTHLTLWDASTLGNPWWIGPFVGGSVLAVVGQAIEIAASDLDTALTYWT